MENKATYSQKAVTDCYNAIKKLNTTVKCKMAHSCKAYELEEIYNKCADTVNFYLFYPDYTVLKEYRQAAYEWKKHTGKELEALKRRSINYIKWELESIMDLMKSGEVNVVA